MLLYSIQKTANFHTQRGQCTERLLNSHTCIGVASGGLSVFVCCVGMAVPLDRTGCKSPPLFLVVAITEAILQYNQIKTKVNYDPKETILRVVYDDRNTRF